MDLEGKVAIVTGGASGIGLGITEVLLEKRCKVCICDINKTGGVAVQGRLQNKYGEHRVIFKPCDVTQTSQLEDVFQTTFERFKQLDIVYNNAGVLNELVGWQKQIDVKLTGVIQGTYLAFKYMDKNKGGNGGVVINTSSRAGIVVREVTPVYGAANHAVKAFTQSVGMTSQEMYGVRVNGFCPGYVQTPLMAQPIAEPEKYFYGPNAAKIVNHIASEVPLSPEEVARASLSLVTDESRSGQMIYIGSIGVAEVPTVLDTSHLTFSSQQD